MDFLIIGIVALGASALTFFSGFGLGTLLLPAFALFFSAPIALAATGAVHLLNNLFKGTLVWKLVDWPAVLRFGVPAIPAAIFGAFVVSYIDPRHSRTVIGCALIAFAVLELQSWFQRLTFPKKYMPIGGLVTGFMGGVSGQQGALRSMFLLKSNFNAQQFIATGVLIAVLIDLARLPTYALALVNVSTDVSSRTIGLVVCGTVSAFAGVWFGVRFMKQTQIGVIRYLVAALMFAIGAALIFGVIGH